MTNNEVMRSVRYALEAKNREVVAMIKAGGMELSVLEVVDLLKNEEEEGFLECPAETMHAFLDGLIYECRGPSDGPAKKFSTATINNNMILRKLRIAFEMRDIDVVDILRDVGFTVSKSEITALFRAPNHRHYMECGDQFLRNFLKGITRRFRESEAGEG
ncbi:MULTISPECIES: DUF1456 family protein [unclassified Lentimonas]|uniref:DUF1456 family protein n=1 Tax=unclassified Lentimonas TaxID=2630993 RepID=UPI001322DA93|nr:MULTISPECIES: DUF1456 family protein [unclassified Lentimonas]CAA6676884.1 Unannotated [Lentimonas sp. CC4]CAA6686690.1 Unannotated [Lentimonas sp. CC6]CAA7075733.1 Unannotated [Lentimonas sp. CC4]CAA7168108.1 Unannotated [Lentimonas sp. CC21]CAA7181744.1 Unannotated [Lentimonas sp. CC8]